MDKKLQAKMQMLKLMSKDKSNDMYKGMGDGLKSKHMSKVTVMAESPEGLKKGLSKAEQILAAKFGKIPSKEEESDESSMDDESEECPACEGAGCDECEGEESDEIDPAMLEQMLKHKK